MRLFIAPFVFILFATALPVHAGALTPFRDLVSTSAVATSTRHTIEFTTQTAVPASGQIVLTPQAGAFTIPASFDYTDVDVLVSSGGPFVDRDIALSATATEDGVTVVSGTSGSITIVLNGTTGIAAGDQVQILLGTHATYGVSGDVSLLNPSTTGSYRFSARTTDASGATLDSRETRIAIVRQVTTTTSVMIMPPDRSNGLPMGALSFNNASIELSLNTNEDAICRYATSTNVAYVAMTGTFSYTGETLHTSVIGGHTNGVSYSYYIRCLDVDGNPNEDDYEIAFSLEATPTIPVSTGQTTGGTTFTPPGGGSGSFPSGAQQLYLATITISGFASPASTVIVLVDGLKKATARANSLGKFEVIVNNLERGAYTTSLYMIDNAGRTSSQYTSTLSLGQGTNNTLSGVIVPLTSELAQSAVEPGDSVAIFGEGAPGAIVELSITPTGGAAVLGDAKKYVATTTESGLWNMTISTEGMTKGTYIVRARAHYEGQSESNASKAVFLGVGEAPAPDFSAKADINGDGKVNLVDFSILLTSWGTDDEKTDLNSDGTTNLADFSILLFNWTG